MHPVQHRATARLRTYPNHADAAALRDLFSPHESESRPIVVFSVSAGEPHKSIPAGLVRQLVAGVAGAGCVPVFVGRTYERNFREEQRGSWINEGIDLIDRLTVPGTARLVQLAAGVVCCHSSINMLAAMERKPQLLLYPESIFETFIRPRTIWAAGIDDADTVHGRFDDYNTRMTERFLMRVEAKTRQPLARKGVEPAHIDVREFLETLPNVKNPITGEDYRQADWFRAWNGYPCYTRAAELIRPKSILEIGAFLGFGLAAFIHGASKIDRVTAMDNESYIPGSQELCAANLSFFGGGKEFVRSLEETRGTYDLVHVDADHTFQGALDDIAFAWGLGPRVMLVDDYGFLEDVRRAAQAFAAHHSLPYKVWQSYRGWAVFARPKAFAALPEEL